MPPISLNEKPAAATDHGGLELELVFDDTSNPEGSDK